MNARVRRERMQMRAARRAAAAAPPGPVDLPELALTLRRQLGEAQHADLLAHLAVDQQALYHEAEAHPSRETILRFAGALEPSQYQTLAAKLRPEQHPLLLRIVEEILADTEGQPTPSEPAAPAERSA